MSSRNAYLAPAERQAATILHRALSAAEARYAAGERNAEALRGVVRTMLAAEPMANTDYVSVADRATLRELETVAEAGALLSLAVRIGKTRLIDNIIVGG
jgi:pantoate--beta-alanine ligase